MGDRRAGCAATALLVARHQEEIDREEEEEKEVTKEKGKEREKAKKEGEEEEQEQEDEDEEEEEEEVGSRSLRVVENTSSFPSILKRVSKEMGTAGIALFSARAIALSLSILDQAYAFD